MLRRLGYGKGSDANEESISLNQLNEMYSLLVPRHMQLFRGFMESAFDFESGFSIDHFYRKPDGSYDGASFPLPVIEVTDICDIFINWNSVDFYSSLSNPLPEETVKEFGIRESIGTLPMQGNYLFKMDETADNDTILRFVAELKRMEART